MSSVLPTPTIHILLATFNGGKFIKEQLESIAGQTHSAWTLTISDDGSTDNTLSIVNQFANQIRQPVTVLQGPERGSTYNFLHLVQRAPTDQLQDLYAFCDQDDVWLYDKLARAVNWHNSQLNQLVRLYCGRTQFVNEKLKPIGLSPVIRRSPSFGNALVQNIASGNTMVMSNTLIKSLQQIKHQHSVWHDWTTYQVATALGGAVTFDEAPSLLYRQHAANVVGANDRLINLLKRLAPLLQGRYKNWGGLTERAVIDIQHSLTPQAAETFTDFQNMRAAPSLCKRLKIFNESTIRRQSLTSNVSLLSALLLNLV
jgi:glycosyltransferase involved in cell wall biosynthesis